MYKILVVGDYLNGAKVELSLALKGQVLSRLPALFENQFFDKLIFQKKYRFYLQDTSGEEESDRTRILSYPTADIFILVFSLHFPARDKENFSFANLIRVWLRDLEKYNKPILVVGLDLSASLSGALENYAEKNKSDEKEIINTLKTYPVSGFVTHMLAHDSVESIFQCIAKLLENPQANCFPSLYNSKEEYKYTMLVIVLAQGIRQKTLPFTFDILKLILYFLECDLSKELNRSLINIRYTTHLITDNVKFEGKKLKNWKKTYTPPTAVNPLTLFKAINPKENQSLPQKILNKTKKILFR